MSGENGTRQQSDDPRRCAWALKEIFHVYHDEEWGGPVHDDRRHFEFLILEAAQAGLSWSTVLNKRDGYRRAFADFDAARVARLNARIGQRVGDDAQRPRWNEGDFFGERFGRRD